MIVQKEDTKAEKDELCSECEPTFAAFLEQMAAHNLEQVRELNPRSVVCPKCGKVHEYVPDGSRESTPRAS